MAPPADRGRPVDRLALIGAARRAVGRREQVHAHVLARDVVAHRQPGLEQEVGFRRLRHRLAAEHHPHLARRRDRVDALIGVARVDEDLLVLLVPAIDLAPVERGEPGELRHLVERRLVAPEDVVDIPPAEGERPVGGVPLIGAVRAGVGLRHQIEPDVLEGEVIDRQMVGLVQQRHPRRIGDRLAADDRADAARARLDADIVVRVLRKAGPGAGCLDLCHLGPPCWPSVFQPPAGRNRAISAPARGRRLCARRGGLDAGLRLKRAGGGFDPG